MRRNQSLIRTALFVAASIYGFAADEALPKAENILDKYIEATGGKARYEKLTSQASSGTFEIANQGVTGTIAVYRAAPNKAYTVMNLGQIGTIEEGVDGQIAWQKSPMAGARIKEGPEKAFAMRAAVFNAELKWRDQFDTFELAGVEKVEDRDCYKIVLGGKNSNPQTRYYDKKTNLLVKMTMTAVTPMGEIPIDSLVSDYREEGGILSPHKLIQNAAGQNIAITITKVEYNTALPASRFDPPAEVKELISAPNRAR